MEPEVNKVKEVVPGVFWALLWCPTTSLLAHLLEPEMGFVLCWQHQLGNHTWREYQVPIVAPDEPTKVLSRAIQLDFILPTHDFIQILPRLPQAIRAVQLGVLPPDYLDMGRIKGRELYRILGESRWHVLLDTPANDFGQVMSPSASVVEQAITLMSQQEG